VLAGVRKNIAGRIELQPDRSTRPDHGDNRDNALSVTGDLRA
jgi:hypothetical protein